MLIDSTLREGAQHFGNYLSLEARMDVLKGLATIGVEEVEMGWLGQEGLEELIEWCGRLQPDTIRSIWCPCREADVAMAARLGVERVNICIPASEAHYRTRLGLNLRGLLSLVQRVVKKAASAGIPYISLGLEDISRADRSEALQIALLAVSSGASRIRLSDTVGVLSAGDMDRLVRYFKKGVRAELAVHCHNDFGMATSNAVAALEAGAEYADVSVLSLGERAGIAPLEQVAAWCAMRRNASYRLHALRPLSEMVARETRKHIPEHAPVIGQDIFACESGLHVHGLGLDPSLYEPYAPGEVGLKRQLRVGGKSGRAALRMAADTQGYTCSEGTLSSMLDMVRTTAGKLGRPLHATEFRQLLEAVSSGCLASAEGGGHV